jgi:hypothetical protein
VILARSGPGLKRRLNGILLTLASGGSFQRERSLTPALLAPPASAADVSGFPVVALDRPQTRCGARLAAGSSSSGRCPMGIEGEITTREVWRHSGLIWREFGGAALLRCVWAIVTRRPTTFLACAVRLGR